MSFQFMRNTDDDAQIDGLINPNTGQPYNDNYAQDRTGMLLNARLQSPMGAKGNPKFDLSMHAKQVAKLECVNCNGEDFYIFMDSHPTGLAACQFRCKNERCKTVSPVFQLKVPDMIDYRMKQMGMMFGGPTLPHGATNLARLGDDD